MILLRLLAPLLLIILAWWGLRRVRQQYSLTTSQFRWLAGASAVLLVVLVLIIVGRLPIQALMAPLIFLVTFALRNPSLLTQLWMWRKRQGDSGGGGRSRQGKSAIKTAWLAMELTHSDGAMDGEVLQGGFRQRRLSELELPELLALGQECQEDSDSLQLLEAYLDRAHPQWRETTQDAGGNAGRAHSPHAAEAMTEALALEVLGLDKGATRDEVVAAHRRLMQKMHPDRGGSDYLAQRINEARDFLLNRRER